MAKKKKNSKSVVKKTVKKTTKKTAKKVVAKKSTKKVLKKNAKKATTKKTQKKLVKKKAVNKKVVKKKVVKKTEKKPLKKLVKKTTKKVLKKSVKTVEKKIEKKIEKKTLTKVIVKKAVLEKATKKATKKTVKKIEPENRETKKTKKVSLKSEEEPVSVYMNGKTESLVSEKKKKAISRDMNATEEISTDDIEDDEFEAFDLEESLSRSQVILTDAEGNRYCRHPDCDQIANVESYCRYHYLFLWKKIQNRKKILADGRLIKYIEELTARYPDKFLEILRKDLKTEKDFLATIHELDLDESVNLESDENSDADDEIQRYNDEVRGVVSPSNDDDY